MAAKQTERPCRNVHDVVIQTRHCDLRNAIQILILIAKICVKNKKLLSRGDLSGSKKQNVRVGMSVTLRKFGMLVPVG